MQQSAQVADPVLSVDSGSIQSRLLSNAVTSAPTSYTAFPSTTVGSTSSSYVAFTTTFSASTTVTGTGVYTLGASGSDFKNVGTGTCDTNGYPYTYAASSSCTTVVSFTPTKPGNRLGAEVLYTSTAGSYYYGQVNGIGNSPEVIFLPFPQVVSTVASNLSAYGVAVDGAGDLWVTDSAAGAVKEFVPASGVYPASPTNTFTGFTSPQGIAIDGIGNVYVGDGTKGYVWRLSATNGTVPAGTAPVAYVTFLTGGTQPIYVAFDPTGNLYFTGIYSSANYLVECIVTSGSCSLITSFTAPKGIAIDSAGYRYVVDSSDKVVYRMPSSSTTRTTVVSGLTLPYGLAVDAAGDVYVADKGAGTSGSGFVDSFLATNGLTANGSDYRMVATGLYAPSGVAVDSSGNVFIADTSNTAVKYVYTATPFNLAFPMTAIGSTSASQGFVLENVGNTALSFPIPSTGSNPSVSNGFTLSSSSTCPQVTSSSTSAGTLAEGGYCFLYPEFQPTLSGSVTGSLIITDNTLAAASAAQTFKLTGTTVNTLTITVVPVTIPRGTASVTLSYEVGYGGNTAPTGTPSLTVGGSTAGITATACTAKLGHTHCEVTYTTSTKAAGQYTIMATQPADSTYAATSASATMTITP